ncbi:MAG: hypothetical protein ACJ79H_04135 [Myxococcales bacterium]
MLPLAAALLAASVGQVDPSSGVVSYPDPPPCAAADVPGCLPGYKARIDRYGRLVYARDPDYDPPLPPPRPQRSYPQYSRPASWASPATGIPRPAPAPLRAEDRGRVALVFMPGVSSFATDTRFDETRPEGQLALEFRGNEGGVRFRLAGEYTSFGKIGELSFKYDFFDGFFFRPFLGVGIGVASINPDPAVRAAGSASAGIDLYVARDFFLTGEVRRRLFMDGTNGSAHGLVTSDRRQTSFLVGMGFYFF